MVNHKLKGAAGFRARFTSEAQYNSYCQSLIHKAENNINMSLDEEIDFCSFLSKEYTKNYSFCEEEFYLDHYLDYHWNETKISVIDFALRKRIKKYWKAWKPEIENLRHSDEIMKLVSKETRDCRKELFRLFKQSKHKKAEIDLLLYSRYCYIKIKRIFQRINSSFIEVENNGIKFHIDAYTVAHTMIRHYAPELQKFGKVKSYFAMNIEYDQVHEHLEYIFHEIEKANHILINIQDIKLEYKGQPFQIYTKPVTKSMPTVGQISINRINTFYPITDTSELAKLPLLTKININQEITIFQ